MEESEEEEQTPSTEESPEQLTEKKEDTLLVVCNFSNVEYDDYRIGVPYPGKYKEIFNSDAKVYGGTGVANPRVKMSKKTEWDERPDSITVKIPPLGISIFAYTKAESGTATNRTAKSKQTKKSSAAKSTGKTDETKAKTAKTSGRKVKKSGTEEKAPAKAVKKQSLKEELQHKFETEEK